MGIKSTFYIDRQTAIDVVLAKINDCTNEELADILLGFKESDSKNYRVCDSPDEIRGEAHSITDLYNFG